MERGKLVIKSGKKELDVDSFVKKASKVEFWKILSLGGGGISKKTSRDIMCPLKSILMFLALYLLVL